MTERSWLYFRWSGLNVIHHVFDFNFDFGRTISIMIFYYKVLLDLL